MSVTLPTPGETNWDVPLNGALTDLDSAITTIGNLANAIPAIQARINGETFYRLVASSTASTNVKNKADFVCDGTDDQVQIQAAVDAAFAEGGGIVQLTSGTFQTTAPITLHPLVSLVGPHGDQIMNPGQFTSAASIKPQATFTGGAVIVLLDQTGGGYASTSSEQRISSLTIDGSASAAGVHGIQGGGAITSVTIKDVTIRQVTGKGIYTFFQNSSQPFSWTFEGVLVDNSAAEGFHLINHTDFTMLDCISIGAGATGYLISNAPNSRMIGCRAEWSDANGIYLTGNFGTGQGSGGMLINACSTDRNAFNGIIIDALGNGPVNIVGCMTRRDGRNNNVGGGGYAGIKVLNATMPVVVSGWTNYVGVDDNGTGVDSPVYAASATGAASVQIDDSYMHGATSALNDDGTNTILRVGANVVYTTGISSAPVRTVPLAGATGPDWFNVKDYGADGNGTTDDTASIAAALTALNATNGGVLYFPAGKYLVNSGVDMALSKPITVQGDGAVSSIRIGSGFGGAMLFNVASDDVTFQDIQIRGDSSTTTSNPVADGVKATAVQTFKMFNVEMQYINGYAVKVFASSANTIHGGQIDNCKIQSCAGAVYIKGDNASGNVAANFEISNLFTRFNGVTSGGSANLDGIRIEDAWDVIMSNIITWMSTSTGGTGVALRVIGNCAATFITNLDALGPTTTGAANVSIENNANGSPQNVQITGGVIQQGIVGLNIAGASTQVRVVSVRFINNATHGATVSSTGPAVYFDGCFFSGNGNGAAGTNYDLNWSGTTTGFVTNCRFSSPIVSTGTSGVQKSINIAAAQNVRFFNADFQGTGAAQANWFTNLPAYAVTNNVSNSRFAFLTDVDFNWATGPGRVSLQPFVSTNNTLSVNVQGTDSSDRFRLRGDGRLDWGPGNAARDTNLYRSGVGALTTDTFFAMGSGQSGGSFNIFGNAANSLSLGSAGGGLAVKEGTNARMGTLTLNGATPVVVNNTSVTATTRIFLTANTAGGTPGHFWVSARTAGTSFSVTGTAGDTSTVAYLLVEPA